MYGSVDVASLIMEGGNCKIVLQKNAKQLFSWKHHINFLFSHIVQKCVSNYTSKPKLKSILVFITESMGVILGSESEKSKKNIRHRGS